MDGRDTIVRSNRTSCTRNRFSLASSRTGFSVDICYSILSFLVTPQDSHHLKAARSVVAYSEPVTTHHWAKFAGIFLKPPRELSITHLFNATHTLHPDYKKHIQPGIKIRLTVNGTTQLYVVTPEDLKGNNLIETLNALYDLHRNGQYASCIDRITCLPDILPAAGKMGYPLVKR